MLKIVANVNIRMFTATTIIAQKENVLNEYLSALNAIIERMIITIPIPIIGNVNNSLIKLVNGVSISR